MPSTTATRTSMASTETQPPVLAPPPATRPRVGMLGVMQELYDDMLPGITERQAAYAGDVAAALPALIASLTAP